jgi:hypothetical protein
MEEADELLSIARMGVDAEAFVRTPLGKFLMDKADSEIMDATSELIGADPEDVKANRDIRNRIHVANMFRTWMRDAIEIGRAAHEQLSDLD